MKEIKDQLNRIESVLEKVAINSAQNTEKIEVLSERFNGLENKVNILSDEVKDLSKEIKNTKLELLDKLAPKDTTDNHEVRITNIEEKVFN